MGKRVVRTWSLPISPPGFFELFHTPPGGKSRHVAFGSVFLREKVSEDERYRTAIQRTLEEAAPVADGVLSPPWAPDTDDWELFGYSLSETREFAAKCLMRRLKVIGIA